MVLSRETRRWYRVFGLGVLMLASGCGIVGSDKSSSSCTVGSEHCLCYNDGSCDDGLTCQSNLCSGGDETSSQAGAGGEDGGASGSSTSSRGGTASNSNSDATGGSGGFAGSTSTVETGGTTSLDTSNLILNGDFSSGTDYWHFDLATDYASISTTSGAYCVEMLYAGYVYAVGWPTDTADAVALEVDASYTFSFRVKGGTDFTTSYATFTAKLGEASGSYTALVEEVVAVASDWTSYSYPVIGLANFAAVGVYFSVNNTTYTTASNYGICLDDVRLVKD